MIMVTCLFRRRTTVDYCFSKMPFIDKVAVYSEDRDMRKDCIKMARFKNRPLSRKWNHAISMLRGVGFSHVVIMGSDDYMNEKTYKFLMDNVKDYDVIGFEDIYFEKEGQFYYWSGYTDRDDPIGAGRVYSKAFLERIDYNLFPQIKNRGLDLMSWNHIQQYNPKVKVFNLKDNDLFLCDVKDGEGLNRLKRIPNLEKCTL